jgi:hypothetical protein
VLSGHGDAPALLEEIREMLGLTSVSLLERRLDGGESALGAVGVVACALHGQLSGAAGPLVPAGDLVGGGQGSASSSTLATASSTVAAATDRHDGVVSLSARPEHS